MNTHRLDESARSPAVAPSAGCGQWISEGYAYLYSDSTSLHAGMITLLLVASVCFCLYPGPHSFTEFLWLSGGGFLCVLVIAHLFWWASAVLLRNETGHAPAYWKDPVRLFALWTTLPLQLLLLSGFPILACILLRLLILCELLPGAISRGFPWWLLWLFLFKCLAVAYIHIRLSFLSLVILDRGVDCLTAMWISWAMTRRPFYSLIGLWLTAVAIQFLGILVCVIGLYLTVPLAHRALLAAYLQARGAVDREDR
jgi:hypothetical protein